MPNANPDPLARPCPPHLVDWYAHTVIGRNVPGGTETSEVDGYFADGRPRRADLGLLGEGWRILAFTSRRVAHPRRDARCPIQARRINRPPCPRAWRGTRRRSPTTAAPRIPAASAIPAAWPAARPEECRKSRCGQARHHLPPRPPLPPAPGR